jgi:cystathionine gamma-synthase/methionine-gamma-lyase
MDGTSELDFETIAAQAGTRVRVGDTISTAPPIDPSTTFTLDSIRDVHAALTPEPEGYAYGRNANPTVVLLEEALATVEGAEGAVACGSGMAAIHAAVLSLGLGPGDRIVAASALYGVTRSLLALLAEFDVETEYVDVQDVGAVETALARPDVRALYWESIANPLLQVPDSARLAEIARARRITSIIDNTFATPYLFRPLTAGADIVVHSATKYIAGHGDVTAGVVAASKSWTARIRAQRTVTGGILSPFEAWLTLRGLRTLPVRMERQCATAFAIAAWLQGQRWIRRVSYPGLAESPYRDVAQRQFGRRFGAMVAFELDADQERSLAFIDALQLVIPGTSLGDAESLILYPALSSHRTLTAEERAATGIGEGLLRLSVGLESVKDLTFDLSRAAAVAGLAAETAVGTR